MIIKLTDLTYTQILKVLTMKATGKKAIIMVKVFRNGLMAIITKVPMKME